MNLRKRACGFSRVAVAGRPGTRSNGSGRPRVRDARQSHFGRIALLDAVLADDPSLRIEPNLRIDVARQPVFGGWDRVLFELDLGRSSRRESAFAAAWPSTRRRPESRRSWWSAAAAASSWTTSCRPALGGLAVERHLRFVPLVGALHLEGFAPVGAGALEAHELISIPSFGAVEFIGIAVDDHVDVHGRVGRHHGLPAGEFFDGELGGPDRPVAQQDFELAHFPDPGAAVGVAARSPPDAARANTSDMPTAFRTKTLGDERERVRMSCKVSPRRCKRRFLCRRVISWREQGEAGAE